MHPKGLTTLLRAPRSSEEFAACRTLVEEAGCDLQPGWAGGAW